MRAAIAGCALAATCACSAGPDLSGWVDLRAPAVGSAVPLPWSRARRPSEACEAVVGMLPRIRERLAQAPAKAGVLDGLDRCMVGEGRGPELAALYLSASRARPSEAAYRHRLAAAFAALADVGEALFHLEAALTLEGADAEALADVRRQVAAWNAEREAPGRAPAERLLVLPETGSKKK